MFLLTEKSLWGNRRKDFDFKEEEITKTAFKRQFVFLNIQQLAVPFNKDTDNKVFQRVDARLLLFLEDNISCFLSIA